MYQLRHTCLEELLIDSAHESHHHKHVILAREIDATSFGKFYEIIR